MRWRRSYVPLIFVPLACLVVFGGAYYKVWTLHQIIPYILAALIGGIPTTIAYGFKRNDSMPERKTLTVPVVTHEKTPSLVYGKTIIRRSTENQHDGTYHDSLYLLEILNTTPNTMALNCSAALDLHNNPEIRDHVALWNKNISDKIPIGHSEFLRLFTFSKFYKGNRPVETKLLFDKKSDVEGVFNYWQVPYSESLQSENAHFPSVTEAFHKTIQRIMNDAIEE